MISRTMRWLTSSGSCVREVARGAVRASRMLAASRALSSASEGFDRVTLARGDGIGPEITSATLRVLEAAGAKLVFDEIEIGERVYLAGHTSGIRPDDWAVLRRNKAFLKAPITTPVGKGYKSLNVSIRKALGLYANVRPALSLTPFVEGKQGVDVVCVRENEEDTYAGIEHQQTPEVVQCLKLVSRPGTERLLRYAFDFAVANNRKRVTVFHKANIMKMTDGLFLSVARELYESERYKGKFLLDDMIIDIGTAMLADKPHVFDVIACPNLYGDIASDVLAQVTGSVGLGSSANIGKHVSMFEAIHGSAPSIAGKNVANPSGMLQAAVLMLQHLGQTQTAELVQNAWLRTIEDGIHTSDIFNDQTTGRVYSLERATTDGFATAVIERLGKQPTRLPLARLGNNVVPFSDQSERKPSRRELHGVDVFVYWPEQDPDALAAKLMEATSGVDSLRLSLITNRGVKVWPEGIPETSKTDHWRCRFRPTRTSAVDVDSVLETVQRVAHGAAEVIKTENLYLFDGQPGFSLGQGE